jgi:hypothetical protein
VPPSRRTSCTLVEKPIAVPRNSASAPSRTLSTVASSQSRGNIPRYTSDTFEFTEVESEPGRGQERKRNG